MLNVALLGLRGHQGIMLDGILQMNDVRLMAVADDDPALLDAVRKHAAVTADVHAYADWRELLDKEDVQIAGVTGTDNVRADVACECARRGLHMMTEKPLAIDLAGLTRVREAVAKAGVRLTIMISMRYAPPFIAIRKAVADGLVGEVCVMSAQKSYRLGGDCSGRERPDWMKSRRTFGGIIPFVGIHALDFMRWTSGREFVEVMAYQKNVGHPEIRELEDSASVLLKLDNGGSASAHLDYCRPAAAPTHGDDRLRIAGNRGVVEMIGEQPPVLITHTGQQTLPMDTEENHFVDFVRAIKSGGDCLAPEADCYRITEICLKARMSAETGKPVKLVSQD